MQDNCTNIYFAARRAAGYTREKAAEMLLISTRSLADYENSRTVPPNDVVERMCICYGCSQYLAFQHLHETNTLAARVIPALERRSVMESVVRLYNRMKRFDDSCGLERLLEIAEDNQIGEDEREDFNAIAADIRELVKTGLELEMFLDG